MAKKKKSSKKKWIQDAIENPGSFTSYAKKEGGMKKGGGIKKEFEEKVAKSKTASPKRKKQANLAITLSKMSKKKK